MSAQQSPDPYDDAVDELIAQHGGERKALWAIVAENDFLQIEVDRLERQISAGYVRRVPEPATTE
jgi:regulator of replication initiation timing